ncbi:hypothetical protein BGX26_011436, partial [Mortierella sp. AD094]
MDRQRQVKAESIRSSSTLSGDKDKTQSSDEGTHLAEGTACEVTHAVAKAKNDISVGYSHINTNTVNNMVRIKAATSTDDDNSMPVDKTDHILVTSGTLAPMEMSENALNRDSAEDHLRFFTSMLAEIDTPTTPFGVYDILHVEFHVTTSHLQLSQDLNKRLHSHAKRMGVNLASMCHLAWAQVLSKTSGQEQVVFGTVLFGRMQGGSGSDQAMGMFINTLPIRIDVGGSSVEESVRQTQYDLASLLEHEHASLALAQRCSSMPAGTPLFNSLLRYRYNTPGSVDASDIVSGNSIKEQECTEYPFAMFIEDGGDTLEITARVVQQFDSHRVCGYMQKALESLADALEQTPSMMVRELEILPNEERETLLESWNATATTYPQDLRIHQLFENQ